MPPLKVDGHDGRAMPRPRQPAAERPRHAARARADVEHENRFAPGGRHPRKQVPLERLRAAPAPVDAIQIPERPRHLLRREVLVVEDLARGTPDRDEEAHGGS
ncbi:MAG: hypothetical protein LC729_03195 [Acidobacteria bacterium]|nr:hypothetical protein [Acidobacteriota bacterium]